MLAQSLVFFIFHPVLQSSFFLNIFSFPALFLIRSYSHRTLAIATPLLYFFLFLFSFFMLCFLCVCVFFFCRLWTVVRNGRRTSKRNLLCSASCSYFLYFLFILLLWVYRFFYMFFKQLTICILEQIVSLLLKVPSSFTRTVSSKHLKLIKKELLLYIFYIIIIIIFILYFFIYT